MSLLGIDVGTTGCKAVVFDVEGNQLASAYREYPLHTPQPDWSELDSCQVLEFTRSAVQEAARAAADDPVTALAVSAQGEAITPVGRGKQILGNAIISSCPRTAGLVPEWEARHDRLELFQHLGVPLGSNFTPLRLEWHQRHTPEVFAEAEKWLFFNELVLWDMDLPPVSDYSQAARSMCLDVHTKEYYQPIFEGFGFDTSKFAPLAEAGTPVGRLTDAAATRWGLPTGTLAVVGAHDQPAAALGVGAIEPGMGCYGLGTVVCLGCTFDQPLLSQETLAANLCSSTHAVPDMFITLIYNFTGGSLLRWYRDTFGKDDVRTAAESGLDVYNLLLSRMPQEPTDLLVLPHFTTTGTPHFDNYSSGTVVGLSLHTTEGEFIRGLLEGLTYELGQCVHLLREAGRPLHEVRCSGGGARSKAWLQLTADILNTELAIPEVSESGCLGMALLAGVGAGVYSNLREAVEATVRISERLQPTPGNVEIYRQRQELYEDLYPRLKSLNHRLKGKPSKV